MNGLALRISKGGGKKTKTSDAFPALHVSSHLRQDLVDQNANFRPFVEATNADEQLKVLKEIFNNPDEKYDECTVEFLSTVFFHADSKHPVKRFLAKNITRSPTLVPQFSKALSTEISSQLLKHSTYTHYRNGVNKITACLENFVPGVEAVNILDIQLANWLKDCLQCCVDTLSNSANLSSTEKNEIFTLSHTSIRLLIHLTTTEISNIDTLTTLFGHIREFLKQLLFNDDVPMDTKSVCGILILNMRFFEFRGDSKGCLEASTCTSCCGTALLDTELMKFRGESSIRAWKEIIYDEENQNEDLASLLSTDASKLALYSAIANTVLVEHLTYYINPLIERLLGVLERNSSESVYVLGVTRTLVAISKNLDRLSDRLPGTNAMFTLLDFVWGYLDHYMDSVRHLTAQLLGNLVRYCLFLCEYDVSQAMEILYYPIEQLDKNRKSYYIAVTALISELGADEVMKKIPALVHDVIRMLGVQAVQASATTTLEVLLQKHAKISNKENIYRTWIEPVLSYVAAQPLDCSVLNVLEGLLVKAVKLDRNVMEFILPNIKAPNTQNNANLKCTLMLLCVARKCNALGGDCDVTDDVKWKDVIGYDVLQMAAVHAEDETRILSLSLIVESPKSTERFTRGELDFVLYYLTYNINAQSPSFRQLTLSQVKKFLKRLEDSYKVLHREKNQLHQDVILELMSKLRDLCFDSLIAGANYSRRVVALTVLRWCENMQMEGYHRSWKEDEVEKLLHHLEDSYESNKAAALAILNTCPKEMFLGKKCFIALDFESVLKQASSLKPTDCVSAAYKFDLLRNKLPEHILLEEFSEVPEPVAYSLLYRLLNELKSHVAACKRSIVAGSAYTPMYPLIHCMGHTVTSIDTKLISSSQHWSSLIQDMISTSYLASEAAGPIVNNSSPEGHLPNDLGTANDYGNSHGVTLKDGRQVTAQMVLLCAWRTVKEVSLLLGDLSSLLTIQGEGQDAGSLTSAQVSEMGSFFTRLLAETKHRGAFEQAYVGFMKLLSRLWRSRSPELHSLPRQWLDDMMAAIASTDKHTALCSTRRSAGLPFMIQALVTTELQVQSNPKCFHQCMTTLLRLARTPKQTNLLTHSNNSESKGKTNDDSNEENSKSDSKSVKKLEQKNDTQKDSNQIKKLNSTNSEQEEQIEEKSENSTHPAHSLEPDNVETRTHAINILRALFRNASLDESVASYVEEGLMVALQGFEGSTWMERNSSTLLFSALMVRIFGVQRSKDGDNLCIRNRMTGRIFFLRYPQLYDVMLKKLQEVCSSDDNQISPSLYPILLLLARLYPSSLEGTVSNLRLVAFVAHVVECARSAVMKTRQLAAKAIVPLIPPIRYVPHLEEMFEIISDPHIERNTCHGILLQLIRLLESKFGELFIGESPIGRLSEIVQNTQWILQQATQVIPCYLLADEYVKVVNLLIWRFPATIEDEYTESILKYLEDVLFKDSLKPLHTCGREVCLANCLYLYFILLNKINEHTKICDLVYKSLRHNAYEVVLSALDFLLILYENVDMENKFLEHLNQISDRNILKVLRRSDSYTESLCYILIQDNLYPECRQKVLKIFTLEESTDKCVYGVKIKDSIIPTDKCILKLHCDNIKEEHENLTHIYLESLCNFVTKKLGESSMNGEEMLEVIRVVFACSSSDNRDETREVVVKFLETNYDRLLEFDLKESNEDDKFEYKATVFATVVTMLEDDNSVLRQRIADAITKHCAKTHATASQNLVLPDDLPDDGINIPQEESIEEKTSTETHKSENITEVHTVSQNLVLPDDEINIPHEESIEEKTAIETSKTEDVTAIEEPLKNLSVQYDGQKSIEEKTSIEKPKSEDVTVIEEPKSEDITVIEEPKSEDVTVIEEPKSEDITVIEEPKSEDVTVIEEPLKNLTIQHDRHEFKDPNIQDPPIKDNRVIPTRAAEILRGSVDDVNILVVLALMDFKSEVYVTDDDGDEGRVFDTNEKYNIFMEETIWARSCADVIKQNTNENTMEMIQAIIKTPRYRPTFEKLCGRNLTAFENVMKGVGTDCDVNPKVNVFFDTLHR